MAQSKSTWKALERKTAKEIGGVRNGNRGAATADAESSRLAVECKSWSRLPAKVEEALQQAEKAARNGELLPIARIHRKGGRGADDLAVVRWSTILRLLEVAGYIEEETEEEA